MEMKQFVYADNAATTKLDIDVYEAMKPYLLDDFGNASQPYSFARSAKAALKDARSTIADCINAQPEEIYFTSGGTEGDNWAIKGVAFNSDEKRVTITSAFEHHAVLHACAAIERLNYPVAYLWPDIEGTITPMELESVITDRAMLVSIMFANNELGSIQPIKMLCDVSHSHRALFHTDAAQAVGHVPIDVKALGVDLLSASAHKFNGPKGIGFMYIKEGTSIAPFVDGGAQEYRRRAGTENIASIVGMSIALKKNCDNLAANAAFVKSIEEALLSGLERNSISYKRNGSSNTLPGLISLSFAGADGEALLHRMDLLGICISTGSACDSKNTEVSHVLKAVKLDENLAKGTIRISLGKNNTPEDAAAIVKALQLILGRA